MTSIACFGIEYPLPTNPTFRYGRLYQIQTGTPSALQNMLFAIYDQYGFIVWTYDNVGNPEGSTYYDHTGEQLTPIYTELNQLTSLSGGPSESYGFVQHSPPRRITPRAWVIW